MSNLIMTVGIPGCGKSTYAETVYPTATVVSSDEIRKRLGDINDQSKNDQVFETFHREIANALAVHKDYVVADATHLTQRARKETRALANGSGNQVHVVMFTNVAQALMRNSTRDRVVPQEAMFRMLQNYERTLRDIQTEGGYNSVTSISDFKVN